MTSKSIAILLGRKGSKGLPGKNTMNILGRPCLHYPILAAIHSRHVDEIFVSTDDDAIKAEAGTFDLDIIDRPPELCTDSALFEDALLHAYHEAKRRLGLTPDFVVILMCNAPTVSAAMIDTAIDDLIADPQADSAVTVNILNMYSPLRARRLNDAGYLDPFVPFEAFGDPKTLNCDRDSQGDVYFADMSHSVSRARCLETMDEGLLPQRWMGQKILPVANKYGGDIDTPWQVDTSTRWLVESGFTNDTTPYDD
jgi:CMP-N-acetylneuraminic acid synthetase